MKPAEEVEEAKASSNRRWLAVILATAIMVMSYVLFVWSLAAISSDELVFVGGVLGIALGLVPAVFFVAAFVSQNEQAFRSGFLASAAWAVAALPFSLVSVPLGLVAGFGFGGVFAFRMDTAHARQSRLAALAGCIAYVFVLERISPELALFGGAPLPFLAIAFADILKERAADESSD